MLGLQWRHYHCEPRHTLVIAKICYSEWCEAITDVLQTIPPWACSDWHTFFVGCGRGLEANMANVTLRCADERLNEIIGKKFPDNVILGELGGIKWYLSRDGIEELYDQLEFAIDHKGTEALNLVSHTDCSLYKELGETDDHHYRDDLEETMNLLHERFPELKILSFIYNVDTKELERIATDD
ncbi:hypothetical protein HY523_02365 [Candidatus Berkelbacteria bacterium]|nr:hypothetical protein [Candidatus Berkelbacteria bacterium]